MSRLNVVSFIVISIIEMLLDKSHLSMNSYNWDIIMLVVQDNLALIYWWNWNMFEAWNIQVNISMSQLEITFFQNESVSLVKSIEFLSEIFSSLMDCLKVHFQIESEHFKVGAFVAVKSLILLRNFCLKILSDASPKTLIQIQTFPLFGLIVST